MYGCMREIGWLESNYTAVDTAKCNLYETCQISLELSKRVTM